MVKAQPPDPAGPRASAGPPARVGPPAGVGLPARVALLLVAAGQAQIGLWGLISPRGFFTGFPGFGHHWVAALGPYDEHLTRDFAAAELGFAVLLGAAALWFERRLVLIAGAAFLVATVPHFAYHLTTTERLPAADNAASLGAFAVEMALVAASMVAAWRQGAGRAWPTPEAGAAAMPRRWPT